MLYGDVCGHVTELFILGGTMHRYHIGASLSEEGSYIPPLCIEFLTKGGPIVRVWCGEW